VEADVFKAAMRSLAAGVVMVTTRFEGRAWGLTISSCCSLSLDPPQILVSLRESTISCREIRRSRTFGVSILGREHRSLAEYGSAAGAPKFLDGFCEREREDQIGTPVVAGAIFHLDCSVTVTYDVSDHVLLVGCVRRAVAEEDAAAREPLLYYNRRFWALGEQLE
jgi:flavin reductase (DIM6/NTAB) family NADH-FMN oxidoreductase RutF